MVRKTTRILGVEIDPVTMAGAVDRCLDFLRSGQPHLVTTPNSEILHAAARDPEVREVFNQADLSVPDGSGVLLASRLLGTPVPEKVAGVELADALMAAAPPGTRVYLLGATDPAVKEAAIRIAERHPHLVVAGARSGYWDHFSVAADRQVVEQVRAAAPHILFCGMGAPRQERWLARYLQELAVPVCMGVGGAIDHWAGRAPRAPRWMIRLHLEWLFRVVRFGRYRRVIPALTGFLWRVLQERRRLARMGPGGGGDNQQRAWRQERPTGRS